MKARGLSTRWGHQRVAQVLAVAIAIMVLAAGCQVGNRSAVAPGPGGAQVGVANGQQAAQQPAQARTQTQQQPEPQQFTAKLQVNPTRVKVGDKVQVTGSGYPANAKVELVWYTVKGHYELENGTEFVGQRYERVSQVLSTVQSDSAGAIQTSLEVPVGFGGMHDLRGRVGGEELSQAGVSVDPTVTMSPLSGPVGTPVELKIVGVDMNPIINTWHILYDNKYMGFVSAVTTDGVAVARFRATGPVGKHIVGAWNNSYNPTPYIAWDTSPFKDIKGIGSEFTFNTTSDPGPAAPQIENFSATDAPWASNTKGPAQLSLSLDRGAVGQKTTLKGSKLPANTAVQLRWSTMVGNRVSGGGFVEEMRPLGNVTTGPDGTFSFDMAIPDDLGGHHRIEVSQGDQMLGSIGMVIIPSIISVTPTRVRVGEQVEIHLKGLGWTTYDNTYTIVYDGAYMGYVCGFSTNGDVLFRITATGAPGTHIVDLYPTIYKGKDLMPRVYSMPQLTYQDDHPARKTPRIQMAIEIVE